MFVLNPAYRDALYELALMKADGSVINDPYPHRFNDPPPDDAWQGQDYLWDWVSKHSVPKYILVEE